MSNKTQKQNNNNNKSLFDKSIDFLQQDKPYSNIIILLQKVFISNNYKNFHMDKSLSGPLIDIQKYKIFNSNYYFDWYQSYNPNFLNINLLEIEKTKFKINIGNEEPVSIYETLIAQICRDICIMLMTRKLNINNNFRTKNSRYKKIEDIKAKISRNEAKKKTQIPNSQIKKLTYIIGESTKELKILEEYKNNNNISKFAKNINSNISDKLLILLTSCEECIQTDYPYENVVNIFMNYIGILSDTYLPTIEESIQKILNSPYIFYPTYTQISYKSVVLLCTAPIINFRISNRKRFVHEALVLPYNDYMHDVDYHSSISHKYGQTLNENQFNTRFELFKNLIGIFYDDIIRNDDNAKIYSFILFVLFHEDQYKSILKNIIFNAELKNNNRYRIINFPLIDFKKIYKTNITDKEIIEIYNIISDKIKNEKLGDKFSDIKNII